ncbi:MAG: DUF6510 family protein [Anaerolineales bacterium]
MKGRRMEEDMQSDPSQELTLDGNAVAGLLHEVFGSEMTVAPAECHNCGKVSQLGETHAYTHAPGVILRCPGCQEVLLRIVRTPAGMHLDARGIAFLRLGPPESV